MLIPEDLLHPLVKKLFFEFEGNYITSLIRKSLLDMPAPGSFRNIGHQIEANKA